MLENKEIEIMQSVYDKNDEVAAQINLSLTQREIYAINVMGAPGAGKTSTILSLVKGMKQLKAYVVEGDIESDIDTKALKEQGIETVQINTHGACHLDAPAIATALGGFKLAEPGIVFIENIGNLVCPAEFQIGEHIKMLVATVTEGSDKPYKYPLAFEKADVIILNKVDLMPYVDFDEDYFMAGVRALNPHALVAKVSTKQNIGLEEVIKWITEKVTTLKQ